MSAFTARPACRGERFGDKGALRFGPPAPEAHNRVRPHAPRKPGQVRDSSGWAGAARLRLWQTTCPPASALTPPSSPPENPTTECRSGRPETQSGSKGRPEPTQPDGSAFVRPSHNSVATGSAHNGQFERRRVRPPRGHRGSSATDSTSGETRRCYLHTRKCTPCGVVRQRVAEAAVSADQQSLTSKPNPAASCELRARTALRVVPTAPARFHAELGRWPPG
jgi:hypothetical protein